MFVASYTALILLGVVPVLAEIGDRLTLDPDDILSRAINLSVGVVDAGLGAAFGINIESTDEQINAVADRFLAACAHPEQLAETPAICSFT